MTTLISGVVGAAIGAVLTMVVMVFVQVNNNTDNYFRYCVGEWESGEIRPVSVNMSVYEMQCSACGGYVVLETRDRYKYCPCCGAKR